MFKIPKWEDDVPTSIVDFGKTNKGQKKKTSTADSHQKLTTQEKSRKGQGKTKQKQPFKVSRSARILGRNSEGTRFIKGSKSIKKNPLNKNNDSYLQRKSMKSTALPEENLPKFNNESRNNLVNSKVLNKKKRPKKRKSGSENTSATYKQEQNKKSKLSHSDVTGDINTKKNKINSDEMASEGSILIEKSTQKKKSKLNQVVKTDKMIHRGTKLDQKKEKLRQMLQLETNRSQIKTDGNKLRQRMLERLKSAQFRFLNEKLYTTSGSEAQKLFQSDPDAFRTYHQGYQQQVKKWPVNPLDLIVKRIAKMPKTHLIADMGCGEAALSRRVAQRVRSFDLVGGAGVEACDMAHTPLLAASTDAAVYCLALMGTDLTQYLVEANRVLKPGGYLLIAEVESRFDKVERFVEDVERLGFKLKKMDDTNKVFFFMEFTKVRDPPAKKSKLPAISLKPCLYKRR